MLGGVGRNILQSVLHGNLFVMALTEKHSRHSMPVKFEVKKIEKYVGPVQTYCAAVGLELRSLNLNHKPDHDWKIVRPWLLTFYTENWQTGYSCRRVNLHPSFRFSGLLFFELWAVRDIQRDRRTDRRTGKTHIAAHKDGCTYIPLFAEKTVTTKNRYNFKCPIDFVLSYFRWGIKNPQTSLLCACLFRESIMFPISDKRPRQLWSSPWSNQPRTARKRAIFGFRDVVRGQYYVAKRTNRK